MSLLGAIADYYNTGSSADLTTLHNLLGSGKMFADLLPSVLNRPFCILAEASTTVKATRVGSNKHRAADISVSFAVMGTDRASTEAILEALDNAYIDTQLTITDRGHIGTYFDDRRLFYDNEAWTGELVLRFRVEKSAS